MAAVPREPFVRSCAAACEAPGQVRSMVDAILWASGAENVCWETLGPSGGQREALSAFCTHQRWNGAAQLRMRPSLHTVLVWWARAGVVAGQGSTVRVEVNKTRFIEAGQCFCPRCSSGATIPGQSGRAFGGQTEARSVAKQLGAVAPACSGSKGLPRGICSFLSRTPISEDSLST
ncbi:hypothetical protein DAEQUDRAFT_192060 [Daedalea quercina L-15889]|uniref:Uncharacterized protein n=1 Tax=Daedalea quercina L-15889 TaxID=1314783 RepID=A0A165U5C8_9APHY|nr:hypothetical protein DAEQUDRAFT_192060 [Daedalea quercina L-15889]